MTSLDDLMQIDGVVFACEFTADGRCTEYRARADVSQNLADRAAEYISTVTRLFDTLAGAFTGESKMNWIPQQSWTYSGGDWTVVVGGKRAVFVQSARADINRLMELLAGRIAEPHVRPGI